MTTLLLLPLGIQVGVRRASGFSGLTPPWLSTEPVNAAEGPPVYRVPSSIKDAKEEKIGKEQLSTGLESLCKCVCGGSSPF